MTEVKCHNIRCPHNDGSICVLESIELMGNHHETWCNELAEIAEALVMTHRKFDPCNITITKAHQLFLRDWWKL